jgi:hypothetical protein
MNKIKSVQNKATIGMKKTHELRNDINPRQINYWINKGFS